jgi:LCP family protein required for cell wall assembly
MNDLIRSAIAAEAEERVDSRTVLAELHKRKARKPFGLIVGVATLTVATAAAAFIIPTAIKKTEAAPVATSPTAPITAQNVLLVGLDDYDLADAIVFAHFTAEGAVNVVSLPRDIQLGNDMLKNLFKEDPKKLTDTVEKVTGTKVDHYAAVRMSDFGRISEAVGGVEVCLQLAVKDEYSGVDLPAGKSVLKGEQALAYLRQRHGLRGDHSRIMRQNAFLAALGAKITKDNALPLAREISKSIRVDQGWDVLEFARRFQGPVELRGSTLPIGDPLKMTGPYVVQENQLKGMVEVHFASESAVQEPGCYQ